MPKRLSKSKSKTKKLSAQRLPATPIAASPPAKFQVGDVVVSLTDSERIATVCEVVDNGMSYRVRFADLDRLTSATEDSVKAAGSGVSGPPCP